MERKETQTKKRASIQRIRSICIIAVFALIVVGLIAHWGLGTLSSLGVGAIAYICPVGALETLLAGQEIIPRLIVGFLCALVLIVLLGRFFCSWVCVVPPLIKFFHPKKKSNDRSEETMSNSLAEDIHDSSCNACKACDQLESGCDSSQEGTKHALAPLGGKRDGLQIDSRHGVLAGALLGSLVCGFPVFCLICPVGLSLALVVGIYSAIFEQNPTISLLIFAVILLLELVFFRKWCHKLCPIGAFMSLVGAKAPVLKPKVNSEKCLRCSGIDCKVCVDVCPEELDPHCKDISECTRCGICIERCPAKAISYRKP